MPALFSGLNVRRKNQAFYHNIHVLKYNKGSVNGKIVPFLQAQCDFSKDIMSEKFQHKVVNTQGHPTSIFRKNLFGRRFKISGFQTFVAKFLAVTCFS